MVAYAFDHVPVAFLLHLVGVHGIDCPEAQPYVQLLTNNPEFNHLLDLAREAAVSFTKPPPEPMDPRWN